MKALTQYPHVEALLPHDAPMALLTRIVKKSNDFVICEVSINNDTMFIEDGFVPVYVGIEYMAQTIAAFSGANRFDENKTPVLGFLLGSPKTKFYTNKFKYGQTLQIKTTVRWHDEHLFQFECSIKDAKTNELLAESIINTFTPNKENLKLDKQGKLQ